MRLLLLLSLLGAVASLGISVSAVAVDPHGDDLHLDRIVAPQARTGSVPSAPTTPITPDSAFAADGTLAAPVQTWRFYSGTSQRGVPLCGAIASFAGEDMDRIVKIEVRRGHDAVTLVIAKNEWQIPRGLAVPVKLDFGDGSPLTLVATGDGQMLHLVIPTRATENFLWQLSGQPAMRVYYPTGSETSWVVPSTGARDAIHKMVECTTANARLPTEPFAESVPTPPWGRLL